MKSLQSQLCHLWEYLCDTRTAAILEYFEGCRMKFVLLKTYTEDLSVIVNLSHTLEPDF